MIAFIQLSLPVVVILAYVIFKLNLKQRLMFFKVPVLISSTVLSIGIGHLARGVMGVYGGFFCDLLLWPALLLVKKMTLRSEKKIAASSPILVTS